MSLSDRDDSGGVIRLGVGLLGILVFSMAVVAVFRTGNGAGSAALVAVGVAVILLALLGDRVQALELGGAKLSLRDVARNRFAVARERELAGDAKGAIELRRQGLALERLANQYAYRRRSMRGGHQRTQMLEHIVVQLTQLAKDHTFDPMDVWDWFNRGKPEARISAIGLMHGDQRLRDIFVALDAIEHSRSAFEQFHGLRLAYEMLDTLSEAERDWLRESVERARSSGRFSRDTDRWELSELLLRRLAEFQPASNMRIPSDPAEG